MSIKYINISSAVASATTISQRASRRKSLICQQFSLLNCSLVKLFQWRASMAPAWDAIVIGSGIGGLSAAGFLAKVARDEGPGAGEALGARRPDARLPPRRRVLGRRAALPRRAAAGVVHAQPVRFPLGRGARMEPDAGRIRALRLSRLRIRCPLRPAPLRGAADRALSRRGRRDPPLFPRSPRGRALAHSRHPAADGAGAARFPSSRKPGVSAPPRPPRRPATYLERHFRSRELKALLATQWGDYGLPPKQSAFALHALVVGSYLNGGWFPDGGAGRIARTIEAGNRGGRRRDPRLPGGDRDPHRERPRRRA